MSALIDTQVGFSSIVKQIERKAIRRGFQFNVMLVGPSGLGKSTLINTLFYDDILKTNGRHDPNTPSKQTTEIKIIPKVLTEGQCRLNMTLIDTPGYGDGINNDRCWEPIIKYIRDQLQIYLKKESMPSRERHIQDTRVHCCIFMIQPNGHGLRPLDITVLKKLGEYVNVIPVIGKADAMTQQELLQFKAKVRDQLSQNSVCVYPFDQSAQNLDADQATMDENVRRMIPFAVIGSNSRGNNGECIRTTRFGPIDVNSGVCETRSLRRFLAETHLQDLIDTTAFVHYENFRTRQLLNPRDGAPPVNTSNSNLSNYQGNLEKQSLYNTNQSQAPNQSNKQFNLGPYANQMPPQSMNSPINSPGMPMNSPGMPMNSPGMPMNSPGMQMNSPGMQMGKGSPMSNMMGSPMNQPPHHQPQQPQQPQQQQQPNNIPNSNQMAHNGHNIYPSNNGINPNNSNPNNPGNNMYGRQY